MVKKAKQPLFASVGFPKFVVKAESPLLRCLHASSAASSAVSAAASEISTAPPPPPPWPPPASERVPPPSPPASERVPPPSPPASEQGAIIPHSTRSPTVKYEKDVSWVPRQRAAVNDFAQAWAEMKGRPQKDPDRKRFVDDEGNEYLNSTFRVTETAKTEDTTGETGGWRSYEFVIGKEGKKITDEMIRLKTIDTRLHRGLVEGQHNVDWPGCLELLWSKDMFGRFQINSRSAEMEDKSAASAEERRDILEKMRTDASEALNATAAIINDGASTSSRATIDVNVEAGKAIKALSQGHSEWDRAKRKWRGVLAMSEQNERTKDTETHLELEAIIKEGSEIDDQLVHIETLHKAGSPLDLRKIAEVKSLCEQLCKKRKTGQKTEKAILS